MMGRRCGDQASLFYQFHLDDRVPKDHLLRRIDCFVMTALADMHERLKPYYSEIGRPSVDPDLMIRMLIVGYCYGLRSERRLTQEVELHAYRWFCRLDLDDKVPHHSTFSENRLHRFRESDVFRHIFERVVVACMAAGDRPKRCCHASAATGAHIAFGADHMLCANPSRPLDRTPIANGDLCGLFCLKGAINLAFVLA